MLTHQTVNAQHSLSGRAFIQKGLCSAGEPLNEPREGRAQALPPLLVWEARLNSLHLCFVGQPPLHQVPSH